MTLNRPKLRALIESVILEGFKDDQRYLIEKHPDHSTDLDNLPPKWIAWLTARFGENPTRSETHPFEDSIVTVTKFARLDSGLSMKYRSSPQFKANVDEQMPPGERGWRDWSDPSQSVKITVDEMELIIGLSERKKERFKTEVSEEEMESDRIGKVGPWNLWMPTTRERSCKIAGYDPVTRKPKTTWCTARMAGSNLFYNYVGRPGIDMTLFYVIKDDPKGDQDWLSVGFVDGKPLLDGKHGSMSVDRANDGLTPTKLQKILGSDHDEIVKMLTDKNRSLEGKHPAREKITSAAKSVEAFKYLTVGLSKDEETDIVKMVLKEPSISPDVLAILAQNPDDDVRISVAASASATPKILAAMSRDIKSGVRRAVGYNKKTPATVLSSLTKDSDRGVRQAVAGNASTPFESLVFMTQDPDDQTRSSVARNSSAPADLLHALASDTDVFVRTAVASNTSSPADVLRALVDDEKSQVRDAIARNPAAPDDVLRELANDENSWVIMGLVGNESTPADVLAIFAKHENFDLRSKVAYNPSTPAELLSDLANDKILNVRSFVALNTATPPEILMKLARDESKDVRTRIPVNPSAPVEVLQVLARDRSSAIRNLAKDALARRQQQGLNERRLRNLIRQML